MDGVVMTQKAPERIWAYSAKQTGYRFYANGPQPEFDNVEYVRADLAQATAPVRVNGLALSNVLKHAFIAGRVSAGAEILSNHSSAWVDYDPTDCADFPRIFDALYPPALDTDAGVVAELVEALREARTDLAAYVDHDYPPETCATYPSVARQHHRDMELCRRIDAALAKWDAK